MTNIKFKPPFTITMPHAPFKILIFAFSLALLVCGCAKNTEAAPSNSVSSFSPSISDNDEVEDSVIKSNIGTSVVGEPTAPLAVYQELLFDYGYAFSNTTIATAVTVAETNGSSVFADTLGNDSGNHSFEFIFDSDSTISDIKKGDIAVIVGTVNEPSSGGDILTVSGCSVYAVGSEAETLAALYQDCSDSQIKYSETVISTANTAACSESESTSFIAKCRPLDYGTIGTTSVGFTIQIQQLIDSWNDVIVIRATDPAYSDATWLIACHSPDFQLNAGDTITVYGDYLGTEVFSAVDGTMSDVYVLQAALLVLDGDLEFTTDFSDSEDSCLFTDVPVDSPYYDSIAWALKSEIVSGTKKDQFAPDRPCTRAQFVTFLWRLAGSPLPQSVESPYYDVTDQSSWYYNAVLWTTEIGITSGSSAGQFSADDSITNSQALVMLWRLADQNAPLLEDNPFEDIHSSDYYYSAVLWALDRGLITASSTHFSPDNICSRAQAITYLYLFSNET